MRCTCVCSILGELDRLLRRLPPCAADYEQVLETVLIESFSRQLNGALALLMREELGFAITALDKNASDASL